jgi:hypothetical protein
MCIFRKSESEQAKELNPWQPKTDSAHIYLKRIYQSIGLTELSADMRKQMNIRTTLQNSFIPAREQNYRQVMSVVSACINVYFVCSFTKCKKYICYNSIIFTAKWDLWIALLSDGYNNQLLVNLNDKSTQCTMFYFNF